MRVIVDSKERRNMALSMVQNIRAEDCPLSVTIEPYIEDHSKEQRNLFHALCREWGKASGYPWWALKEYVKRETLGTTEITMPDGEIVEVICSSEYTEDGKRTDKAIYSELIENLYRIAAESGIQL